VDRSFGDVAIAGRKWASGVWEEEKRAGKSPPIADIFVFSYQRDHIREQKKVKNGEGATGLLLTLLSIPAPQRPLAPLAPVRPVAEAAAFESCVLTMRTERGVAGVGFRPPEKGARVYRC
jgi:hypothetical protein